MNFPKNFINEDLSNKWFEIIKIRNVCNISIEEKRATKEIGSSLEAALEIEINEKNLELIGNIDLA